MLPSDTIPTFPKPTFIWADKMALVLTALAAAIWAVCWWAAYLVVGDLGADYLWLHYGRIGTEIGVLGLMAVWLMLRVLDLVAAGSTWRLGVDMMHGLEPAMARLTRAIARRAPHPMPQIAR